MTIPEKLELGKYQRLKAKVYGGEKKNEGPDAKSKRTMHCRRVKL